MSTSDPIAGASLPDVETLSKLANQFFSALPSGVPGANGLPSGLSHLSAAQAHQPKVPGFPAGGGTPTGSPDLGFSPGLVPSATSALPSAAAATVGIPLPELPALSPSIPRSFPTTPAPAVPPHLTGDVPLGASAHGVGQPSAPVVPAGVPASPSLNNPLASTHGDIFTVPLVNPTDFGLPGDAELKALLSPRSPGAALTAPPSAGGPTFYFLEHAGFQQASGVNVPGLSPQPLAPQPLVTSHAFDVNLVRRDFPIFKERVNGRPLIWLDNAATTQKPQSVIDRVSYFYEHENSNIHRAAHELAARATDAYEGARETTRKFLNARSVNEIVFVRGTTEAINLVAKSWGRANIKQGDEIIVSHLEHHANIVPWQQLCAFTGAKLRVIPVDDDGQILLDEYAKLLNPRTKLVSFTQVSNALGTVTPAKQMVAMAHSAGARVLVDGAQSVSHMRSDVIDLDCDWFVFSGHKIFGPTGIGALYGKEALLNETPPWQGGGNMIKDVTFEHTEYHDAPGRFEAGTGNIADAVGLGAALDYVMKLGIDAIGAYEHQLLVYATRLLKDVPGLRLIGTAADKASVMSFTLQGYKTEEVGAALNKEGIAVRSGHHCAQPILRRFGLEATVRPSLAFYNTTGEVDTLVRTLHRLAGAQGRV
jgi:cysteine desulfurase/selenocysteine lyase